ncbi:hypothetical protein FB446DRAFT_613040, partial [Lentinula raphanica]
ILTDFSQHSHVFEDRNEWQTLGDNVRHMVLDVQVIHNHRNEQSHHGRPEVIHRESSGSAGRPRTIIDPDFLRWAHTHRTTSGIADFLGVSQRTVRRALLTHGFAAPGNAPQGRRARDAHNSETRDPLYDPLLGMPDTFPPEVRVVIHGFIDGYSRMITGLRAANNNRPSTVLSLFISA